MQNYERKVRKMKKVIKNLVVENSALCDNIANVQNNVDVAKQEREFLLRKLIEHEPTAIEFIQQNNEPKYKKRKNSSSDASSINKPLIKKVKVQQSLLKKQTQSQIPKLPIVIDGITLLNLGRIVVDRPAYHSESCIYPVGYKISRTYNNKTLICRIIDNGMCPMFEAYLAKDPTQSFSGPTSDDCHAELLQAFDNFNNVPYVLDGDQFFGLINPRIREFISVLPSAKKLMRIKQEIKQESLTLFDDNASSYMMSSNL